MTIPRKYSVADVQELVEVFRNDPETMTKKYQGMQAVVELLAHFEYMTDEEIEAEARNNYKVTF